MTPEVTLAQLSRVAAAEAVPYPLEADGRTVYYTRLLDPDAAILLTWQSRNGIDIELAVCPSWVEGKDTSDLSATLDIWVDGKPVAAGLPSTDAIVHPRLEMECEWALQVVQAASTSGPKFRLQPELLDLLDRL